MSVSLQVKNVSKGFVNPLFFDVNLSIFGNEKIALIGDNGSGKSTFLKILAGGENADSGTVVWNKNVKIGYLEQEIVADIYAVSGGEQKIIKITELFYGDYDVLLLDEPDNHLDLDHKMWFEQIVQDFEGVIIVISHDRNFLQNSITKTWHLEEKHITEYDFGYQRFKEIYEKNMESRQHLWEVQEKERLRLKEIVRQMHVKAASNENFAKLLHSAEKKYDRFVEDQIEKPPAINTAQIKTNTIARPKRKTALLVKNISKNYSKNLVLDDINLHLFCGEKISIAAPNGSGKTTLLNILVGKLKPDLGEFFFGPELQIGYYAQEHLQALNENTTLVDELQKSQPFAYYDAIGYLKRFLFTKDQITNDVRFLSGGQKSRLQLAKFLATNPDILILDEPTNHLDLKTVLALENFLKEYLGTLILVSHDQTLVNNVVSNIYDLRKGQLTLRAG